MNSEPHKIVLILGNGFDLDLGLKTSYKDFWESDYCKNDYPAPLVHHLNQRWPDSKGVKWYDLENELLNYYKGLKSPATGEDLFTKEEKALLKDFTPYNYGCGFYNYKIDILNSLIEKGALIAKRLPSGGYYVEERYNKKECLESPIWRDREALHRIKKELCNYIKSLDRPNNDSNSFADQVLLAMMKSKQEGNVIDIFSFNYTQVLYQGFSHFDISVQYMHGSCEKENLIVGTRDDTEIVPEYAFLQKSMDDSFAPPDIVTPLREADEVIIFGHSLGENDRQYFAPFFKRQSNEENPLKKEIIIFTRDTSSQREIKRAMQRMTDGHLSSLYSINQPVIIRTRELANDKESYMSFLINHGFEEDFATECISKLVEKGSTKE